MANLGDTGSTQVNENNPYKVALANKQGQGGTPGRPTPGQYNLNLGPTPPPLQLGAGVGRVPAELAPAGEAYAAKHPDSDLTPVSQDYQKALDSGIPKAQLQSTYQPPTAEGSTYNTPEYNPTLQASEQAKADAAQQKYVKSGYNKKDKPALPTANQENAAAEAPDQSAFDAMPAEFQSTLAQIAPYMSVPDSGNAALNAAEQKVDQVSGQTDNAIYGALKGLGTANKEQTSTIATSGILQAVLGLGKYEQTYQGALPDEANWSASMKDIYKYLAGSGNSASLQSIEQAASSGGTSASSTPSSGGASASGG